MHVDDCSFDGAELAISMYQPINAATALGKSLNNDIERLKVSLDASEKSNHRLQAMFDDAKQIASDMKRQLKLGTSCLFVLFVCFVCFVCLF